MKKKLFLLTFFLLSSLITVFSESGPIKSRGWNWKNGWKVNGNIFYDVSETYFEQDGYAYIEGYGNLHYWLYDTYTYHNGDVKDLLEKYIPNWLESIGYKIDLEDYQNYSPNTNLAESVKKLMKQRKCDISVLLNHSNNSNIYLVINSYSKSKNAYSTYKFPLKKISNYFSDKDNCSNTKAPLSIMGFNYKSTISEVKTKLDEWGFSWYNGVSITVHDCIAIDSVNWMGDIFNIRFHFYPNGKISYVWCYPPDDARVDARVIENIWNTLTKDHTFRKEIKSSPKYPDYIWIYYDGKDESEFLTFDYSLKVYPYGSCFGFYFNGSIKESGIPIP